MQLDDWPGASPLASQRLSLEPLRVDHAEEMAPLLDDPRLHEFIGSAPADLMQLRERYGRQARGRSSDGTQRWFNWVARRLGDGQALGFVQATVTADDGGWVAEVAWVVASPYQGRGYAREAAQAMAAWLRPRASLLVAHIHPRHEASVAIARSLGLSPTRTVVDGEVRWEG